MAQDASPKPASGFGALWAFDHATPTPDRSPAWEASSVLVAMAAYTRTISIGILVFDVLLRHPFILGGSVAVAQEVSGGRIRVGLGLGDRLSRLDHLTLGIPFPPFAERVRVLEACCRALPALWRGETVSDRVLGLKDAALGPVRIEPPPLIVGGGNPAVLEVAIRHAQGWNLFTHKPDVFGSRVEMLATMEASAGRSQPLAKSVYFIVERLPEGIHLQGLLEKFEAVGAEEAVLVLLEPGDEAVRRLARRVL